MLRQRVITALLMAPLALLVILWLPHEITTAAFSLLVLAGAWEWSAFPCFVQRPARYLYVLAVAAIIAALWWTGAASHVTPSRIVDGVLIAACLWWLGVIFWIAYFPSRVTLWTAAFAGLLVLVPAWVALVKLHSLAPPLVLFLVLLVVAADVGAYFGGRRYGRHKLAPRVSPGKTWEGVAGGLVAAGVMATVGVYWFSVPAPAFAVLCAVVFFASVVGDLTESLFKRHAGLKDSGSLLPGHGGVLDRVDSVTAAAPIFLVGLERLGIFR